MYPVPFPPMKLRKLLAAAALALSLAPFAAVPASSAAEGCDYRTTLEGCFTSGDALKPTGSVTVGDGTITGGLRDKIVSITNRIISLVALVAIGGIVFGGFRMVTAFGDDEKHKNGKDALKWSIIGFTLALVSFPLVNATVNLFYSASSGG